jgi:acyl-CoA thioesterase
VAEAHAPAPGAFDRDTAVLLERGSERERTFAAEISPEWRAGRGPHGGYLAAMLLRALVETVADPLRSPRSLTIHYPRAPEPGPVEIRTAVEREGRSLSTLSARMEQDGQLMALALAAFSVPWRGAAEISGLAPPRVAPADLERRSGDFTDRELPPFVRHLLIQPRIGVTASQDPRAPMEVGAWLGLAEPRPVDALALAFYSDALVPAPFARIIEPAVAPTIDLTVHFRTAMPRFAEPDPDELCLVRTTTRVIHEGFFEEDGVVWAADGTVLAQSRQLAILLPVEIR